MLERQAQVVFHAHVPEQARFLRDVTNSAIDHFVGGNAREVLPVEPDRAVARRQKSTDRLHDGGFAGAVQPDQARDRGGLHLQIHVPQDVDIGDVAGGYVVHFQQRAHAAASPRYASITARSVSTARVSSSAITRPAFMQIVRGQSSMMTGMS